MSDANRTEIYAALETNWAEVPDQTAVLRELPSLSNTLGAGKQVEESERIRADLQGDPSVLVGESAGGGIPIEFTAKNFDEYIRSAINGDSIVDVDLNGITCTINLAAQTIAADAGTPFTAAMQLAKYIRVANQTVTADDGVKRVVSMTDSLITCAPGSFSADDVSVSLDLNARYVRNGTTLVSFLMETLNADLNKRFHYRGMAVGQMQLSVQPRAKITGSLNLIGENEYIGFGGSESASAGDGSPSNDYGTQIINSSSHVGALLEGGAVPTDALRAFTLDLNGGKRERPYVGSTTTRKPGLNRVRVGGNAEFYFETLDMYTKFRNHTDSSLQVPFTDQDGNFISMEFPLVKYKEGSKSVDGQDTDIFLNMGWEASKHPTKGYTCQFDLLPAS